MKIEFGDGHLIAAIFQKTEWQTNWANKDSCILFRYKGMLQGAAYICNEYKNE